MEKLSTAMNILTNLAKDRGLIHITEVDSIKSMQSWIDFVKVELEICLLQVVELDDESYSDYNGPFPICTKPSI